MNKNSIKFRIIHKEFTFEYRYGDNNFFFVWKTDGLDPEQRFQIPNSITYRKIVSSKSCTILQAPQKLCST